MGRNQSGAKQRKSILGRGNSEYKGPGVRKEEENGRKQSLKQVLNRKLHTSVPQTHRLSTTRVKSHGQWPETMVVRTGLPKSLCLLLLEMESP